MSSAASAYWSVNFNRFQFGPALLGLVHGSARRFASSSFAGVHTCRQLTRKAMPIVGHFKHANPMSKASLLWQADALVKPAMDAGVV